MDINIKSEDINVEKYMSHEPYCLESLVENFNPLLVMTVGSPAHNTQHMDFYLVGGRLYYIVRDEYKKSVSTPPTVDNFIFDATPVSIETLFNLRKSFMRGIRKTSVGYLGSLSAYYKDFRYTAVVLYKSINSTITVYGYSNTSYRFAANKANEFINPLISVCRDINYEIDKGYDPLSDPIPTKLLLEIKKVIM